MHTSRWRSPASAGLCRFVPASDFCNLHTFHGRRRGKPPPRSSPASGLPLPPLRECPQRPVGRRTGTRADATLCGGGRRPCGPAWIFFSRFARNLSGQLVPTPPGLPKVAVRPARSVRFAPVLAGWNPCGAALLEPVGCRRDAARPNSVTEIHWLSCRRSPLGRGSGAGRVCPVPPVTTARRLSQ